MSTVTESESTIDTLSDALEDMGEVAAKKSHKLLKLLVLLGIGAIIFAVVRQLTSDSEPEPYEPAGTNNSSS